MELDPLLSNLSPSSTLEALTSTDAVTVEQPGRHQALSKSIADASTSERALCIRAALAGKKLREWYLEVKGWPWPQSGFARTPAKDQASSWGLSGQEGHLDRVLAIESSLGLKGQEEEEKEYWGCLPASRVLDLEAHIEQIRDDMETLDVEELKSHVKGAHSSSARPISNYAYQSSTSASSTYNHLDDFTVLITATIMHALPYMLKLNALLDSWSTRIAVLRQVPGWFAGAEDSSIAMEAAWEAIGRRKETNAWVPSDLDRKSYLAMKSILQGKVADLGQRTDAMLDMLEGGVDRLPEEWIDRMDALEEDYQAWVAEAERVVDENEWGKQTGLLRASATLGANPNELTNDTVHLNGHATQNSSVLFSLSGSGQEEGVRNLASEAQESTVASLSGLDKAEANDEGSNILQVTHEDAGARLTKDERETGGTAKALQIEPSHDLLISLPGLVPHSRTESSSSTLVDEQEMVPSGEISKKDQSELLVIKDGSVAPSESTVVFQAGPLSNQATAKREQKMQAVQDISVPPHQTLESVLKELSQGWAHMDPAKVEKPNEDLPFRSKDFTEDNKQEKPGTKSHETSPKLDIHRPQPLDLSMDGAVNDGSVSSDASYPGSASSGYFSNMSSPEILSASRVEYFGTPTEIQFPLWGSKEPIAPKQPSTVGPTISRRSSERTERAGSNASSHGIPFEFTTTPLQRSRASSFMPEPTIPEHAMSEAPSTSESELENSAPRLKRASVASIEVLPRSEVSLIELRRRSSSQHSQVRNFTMRRSGSHSSTSSAFSVLTKVKDDEFALKQPLSPVFANGDEENYLDAGSSESSPHSSTFEDQDQSPPILASQSRKLSFEKPDPSIAPPLVPKKSPRRLSSSSTPDWPLTSPKRVNDLKVEDNLSFKKPRDRTISNSSEDQLEARISSILTSIPADIQLTSGVNSVATEGQRPRATSAPRKSDILSPGKRLASAQASNTTLTLSPAHGKTSKSKSHSGDSEIKLYHLHQPGKEHPIKLYVRLVGENGERVMVRVGGGWADLAEYLKEYAIHHGRRSVSDGRFEIQGLPSTHSASSVATLGGFSREGTPKSRPESPALGRPSPSLQVKKNRSGNGSPTEPFIPSTPEVPTKFQDLTPDSVGSYASTGRSSSRMSWTDDDAPLGLAGPKSKHIEISPSKKAWVNGMIDRARTASAEKPANGGTVFGDLGKVGGTRRVFMKPGKADEL